jgi:uncharacterized C2H2 Zn-finger protein
MTKQMIWAEVSELSLYALEGTVHEAIAKLQSIAEEYPTARLDKQADYDGNAYLSIRCQRLETDKEEVKRMEQEAHTAQWQAHRDKQEYERLKKLYETGA